mmetsp:Transcript_53199/g.159250  ORF Transcript_53199/g.159250 Transcript_53199/m.159250 type:complete len:351 (-) Transcript_53199:145-1197(-)
MGDRVDLSKGEEGDLVVGVVAGATESKEHGEGLGCEIPGLDDLLEGSEEGGAFHREHHGDENGGGHGREDGVQVLRVEVLPDLLPGHGLLGQDAAGRRGHVREHGRGEGEDGEGQLLHGGDGHATNDGEEGGVHEGGELLTEEEEVEEAGDDRLGSLDDVSEGDSAGAKGDDGSDVDTGVAESNGEEGLKIVSRELGGLAGAREPQGEEVEDAGGHLNGGDGPGVVEHVEGLLVVNVVSDVEQVPEGEVGADLEGLHETTGLLRLSGGGLAAPGGREGHGRHLVHAESSGLGRPELSGAVQHVGRADEGLGRGRAGHESAGRVHGGREGQHRKALTDRENHGRLLLCVQQ